jgi:hypothetical protein
VLPIANDIVVVAVSPSEAVVLTSLVESGVGLHLFLIPTGTVEVDVPMPALLMDNTLQVVGRRVDVLAALRYINVDEEFQSILPSSTPQIGEDETRSNIWQLPLTDLEATSADFPLAQGDELSPNITIQRIIENALVVQYLAVATDGEGGFVEPSDAQTPIVTILVSAQDAVVLNYLIEANIPLAFVRSAG